MAKTGAVAAVVLACTLSVQADARLAGIWNLKVPVGNIGAGVRTVLLKVEEKGGRLTAKITNIGNKAEDVDKLEVSDGRLVVEYGAYKYDLKIVDDDRIAGTVTSPSGAHQVTGARQEKLLYAGDDPAPFHRFWIGSVGLRTDGAPPTGEPDPAGWIKRRMKSPADLVLVARRQAIGFSNAEAFASVLLQHAGRPVTVTGTWQVDRIAIEKVEPAPADKR
jgi:hypothetical protein